MTDRLPPHSVEAEQGLLSCMLQDPQRVIPDAVNAIQPETFYDLRHQVLYGAIVAMWDARKPVNLLTLRGHLNDRKELENVGGIAYLAEIQDACPSAWNSDHFVTVLKEKLILRRMIQAAAEINDLAWNCSSDEVSKTLDHAQQAVISISSIQNSDSEKPIKELVKKAIGNIEEIHQNQGKITGIPTGFDDFDRLTNGMQNGDMIVIAARPSVGKTSLAMCIAEHVSVELSLPVGVFSLEMTAESLAQRLLLSRSRISLKNIRDGIMAERDFPKLTISAGRLTKAPLHIDDTSGLSILQLRSRARRMFQRHGIKLFVIDYLQLLHSTSKKADNRQQEISDISNGTKALAKELNVPVVVLSQLNRELERNKNRKPQLSDLRESGSIEQDADVVGLLYKPIIDGEEPDPQDAAIPVNLLIAKQRNGEAGIDVPLTFLKPYTRFESRARTVEEPHYEQPHWTDK